MPHFASQALVVAPGLSTASGIGDYASKAGGSIAPHKQHGGVIAVNTPRFLPLLRTCFWGGTEFMTWNLNLPTLYIYIFIYLFTGNELIDNPLFMDDFRNREIIPSS